MGAYLRKKGLSQRFSPIRFAVVVVATLSVFVMYKFVAGAAQHHHASVEATRLREQVTQLQQRQEDLQRQLTYVSSDAYVEYVARTQIKWSRTGETVVVVVPSSHQIAPVAQSGGDGGDREATGMADTLRTWWQVFFPNTPPVSLTPQ